jgi:hypothetical protein
MTRSPSHTDNSVNSGSGSPFKKSSKGTLDTSLSTQKNGTNIGEKIIPKLKLSFKFPGYPKKTSTETIKLDENTRPDLPKITLSVRRTEEQLTVATANLKSTATIDATNQSTNQTAQSQDPPKRKRGRPPKNINSKNTLLPEALPSRPSLLKNTIPVGSSKQNVPRQTSFQRPLPTPTSSTPTIPSREALSLTSGMKGSITAHSTISDADLAKISRLKGHMATFLESDIEAINHADYKRPFTSKQDMIDRLLPFHLLSLADIQVYIPPTLGSIEKVEDEMQKIKTSFESFIRNEHSQTIPTELRSLEQRLCLEEEKFLLEKMRAEYKRRLNGPS